MYPATMSFPGRKMRASGRTCSRSQRAEATRVSSRAISDT